MRSGELSLLLLLQNIEVGCPPMLYDESNLNVIVLNLEMYKYSVSGLKNVKENLTGKLHTHLYNRKSYLIMHVNNR